MRSSDCGKCEKFRLYLTAVVAIGNLMKRLRESVEELEFTLGTISALKKH